MEVPDICAYRLVTLAYSSSASAFEKTSYVGNMTYSSTTGAEGSDRLAGSKDVNDTAVVGEACPAVIGGSCANSASTGLGSRRSVGGIAAIVTGGDGEEDAAADHVSGRVVESCRVATSEAHVDDNTAGAAAAAGVACDKVHAADNG